MKLTSQLSQLWWLLFFLCVCLLSSTLKADKLELAKGDIVHGRFVSATDDELTFESDSFGLITVSIDRVKKLKLDNGIKVDGKTECELESFTRKQVRILCGLDVYSVPHAELARTIEPHIIQDIDPPWRSSGTIKVAGETERGNEHGDEWNIEMHYTLQKERHRNRIHVDYENDINQDGNNDEEYFVSYDYDWFFTEKWFLNGNSSWEKDDSENIADEFHHGAGAGYQVLQKTDQSLAIEFGYAYIKQEFNDADSAWGKRKEFDALTWSIDWWISPIEIIKIFHNHQLTQSLQMGTDYELDTATGIRFFATKALYGELQFEWDKRGEPSKGNTDFDETWTVGLGVEW